MAKDKEKKEGGGKGAAILIAILMITTFLSTMALLIKLDVGGFGTLLRPVFKDVPGINKILPDAGDEEASKESDYPYRNLSEALDAIKVMDESLKSKDAEISTLNDKVKELEAEVSRLSAFEAAQSEFEEKKKEFYDEIVYGDSAPSADTYVEWYNQLDAEHAEQVYREIITARQADDDIKKLAKSYESMDAKKAAGILEKMSNDLDTVALIMSNMSNDAQGKVLAEMDPEFAASVTKKLLP